MSTARLTWKDPTTRTDGTPLAPTDIARIDVMMSADNGQEFTLVGQAAAGQQAFEQELDDAGTYLFKLVVVDAQTPARFSKDSAVVSVIVAPPALAAPSEATEVAVQLV